MVGWTTHCWPTVKPATSGPSSVTTPENSWPSVMGIVSWVHRCGFVGTKVGPPRCSCRPEPQIPTYAGATCPLCQLPIRLCDVDGRQKGRGAYSDLSCAALGLSHIALNPDIFLSVVSCRAHVCTISAFWTPEVVSRLLSVEITLLMNAHSIMTDIRSSLAVW